MCKSQTKKLTTAQRLSLTSKSTSKISKVKRCLFGKADPVATKKFLEQQLSNLRKQQSLKWNYDFDNDCPLDLHAHNSNPITWNYDQQQKRYIGSCQFPNRKSNSYNVNVLETSIETIMDSDESISPPEMPKAVYTNSVQTATPKMGPSAASSQEALPDLSCSRYFKGTNNSASVKYNVGIASSPLASPIRPSRSTYRQPIDLPSGILTPTRNQKPQEKPQQPTITKHYNYQTRAKTALKIDQNLGICSPVLGNRVVRRSPRITSAKSRKL